MAQKRAPQHSAGLNVARDVVLALGGKGAGRHVVRTIGAELTLADLLEPVVPDASFPGFSAPMLPPLDRPAATS